MSALSGNSFGSFFCTIAAANEPRFKAVAVTSPNLEPGCHTIFEEASPTFKQRFMYMAQISDEARFDAFRKTISWKGHAEKIRMPYLCVGGESDELAPIPNVEHHVQCHEGPASARHLSGFAPRHWRRAAATLGPYLPTLVADWMAARMADKPMKNERWFVDETGKVTKSPF